ncbi:MAG: type 1 periplasmic binding fold superfamily protein [Saprospiraceae bacterium]|nr:type 1 periplasmic binding fold superfamily protein [Saprospiraceae bacterium]
MFRSVLSIFFILLVIVLGCKKDDPIIPNEEEIITSLKYTLTPVGGGNTVLLSFKDLDGDGGNSPVIMSGKLSRNTTYLGSLELLNEQESPVGNITNEIEMENKDHQFFFTVSGGLSLTVSYDDTDGNGKPVGLKTRLTTTVASAGKLTITLRHLPDKSAPGVASGNIANAGGDTDIEVNFEVNVE